VLSQRTVSKLEQLLKKMCVEQFYYVPVPLSSAAIYKYLYEEGVHSQLLNYLGNQYDFQPMVFVRAIHDGHPIQQFARTYFGNSYLNDQDAVDYADTILLIVGTLAIAKFKELDSNSQALFHAEVNEFVISAQGDGFPFASGAFRDSKGNAVNVHKLWDLSSGRPSSSTPISTPAPVQVPAAAPKSPQAGSKLSTARPLSSAGLEPSNNGNPLPSEEARAMRPRPGKVSWVATCIVIGLIVVAILLAPVVHTILSNRVSPVVVPTSHFVGFNHGKNKKLIVFVHGVLGDMDNTWVNPETHASWPNLIKDDPAFGAFDVFVYGYASPALGNTSNIDQISVRFLQQLRDREFFSNYDEIDFITHSMGGIVTKRMLNMLNTPADNLTLQRVHKVIYMSVPSNGADLAAVASWLSENPQFKSMSPGSAADFLQSVEGDWATLLRERTASSPFPRTYSAYETLPMGPILVVPRLYISELSDGPIIGFDYNHKDIVKPKDNSAEVYLWVKSRVLEKVDQRNPQPGAHAPEHWKTVEGEFPGQFSNNWEVKFDGTTFSCPPSPAYGETLCKAVASGNTRVVQRFQTTDNNTCTFYGTVDGDSVRGTYTCSRVKGSFEWHATIH
jgi:pimeloyl-ACP methyl ester carboxylesterase